MANLNRVVAEAIRAAPVTVRELARRAGISHAQLARIVLGERNATPTVAEAVARALDGIGQAAARAAARVRRAVSKGER